MKSMGIGFLFFISTIPSFAMEAPPAEAARPETPLVEGVRAKTPVIIEEGFVGLPALSKPNPEWIDSTPNLQEIIHISRSPVKMAASLPGTQEFAQRHAIGLLVFNENDAYKELGKDRIFLICINSF